MLDEIPIRTNGVKIRDIDTDKVLIDLRDRLKQNGVEVYWIYCTIHRKYCDLNRTPEQAYEHESMVGVYEYYHAMIAVFVEEVMKLFPGEIPLLIDIHGQGAEEKTIFRGTQNGETVRRMREMFGDDVLTGENGLLRYMSDAGYVVKPDGEEGEEVKKFSGGFTVKRYSGLQNDDGLPILNCTVDAIQLELGRFFRSKDREGFVGDFSSALLKYLGRFDPFGSNIK